MFGFNKRPLIMGILNVTPDSFFDGGKYFNFEDAINHAKKLIQDGANIIDIGGESTRPGAKVVSEEEELKRVIPVIRMLAVIARRDEVPTKQSTDILRNEIASSPLRAPRNDTTTRFLISTDTYKSNVARLALEAGADMINDVSGLTKDPDMIKVAADANCQIVIMHNRGIPATKPVNALRHCEERSDEAISQTLGDCFVGSYEPPRNDVFSANLILKEVYSWLQNQTNFAIKHGVKHENIIIDPGIGFGKTPEEDLALIENLKEFKSLGFPILVGPSRKSFIKKIFGEVNFEKKNKEMIELAIKNGADIVRMH